MTFDHRAITPHKIIAKITIAKIKTVTFLLYLIFIKSQRLPSMKEE